MISGYAKKRLIGLSVTVAISIATLICLNVIKTNADIAEWWAINISQYWIYGASAISDLVPFSVFEFFIIACVIICLGYLIINTCRLIKGRKWEVIKSTLRLIIFITLIGIIYTASAGFAYYRKEIPLPYSSAEYDRMELVDIYNYFMEDYVNLAEKLPRDENGGAICPYNERELAEKLAEEYERLGDLDGYLYSHTPLAKPILNSWFMKETDILGVTFCPTGEANYHRNAPKTDMIQTIAHELAHSKGVMRENDANRLSYYLLLASKDEYLRYCGYYSSLNNLRYIAELNLTEKERESLLLKESELSLREHEIFYDYWYSTPSVFSKIAAFFNNLYLKLNGAVNGTDSYYDDWGTEEGDTIITDDGDELETMEITFSQLHKTFFYLYETDILSKIR